jgi:hypothetical protein
MKTILAQKLIQRWNKFKNLALSKHVKSLRSLSYCAHISGRMNSESLRVKPRGRGV